MSGKYVFVSYAHEDAALMKDVVSSIRKEGLFERHDNAIVVGEEYKPQILAMIRQAGCALVIWTKQSVAREYVLYEAAAAHALGKLVPARDSSLANDDIPAALNTLQAIALDDRPQLMSELRKRIDSAGEARLSRRQLLLGGAMFGLASVATASLHPTTRDVLSASVSPLLGTDAQLPAQCQDLAKILLLGTGHNVHIIPSLNNPYSLTTGITNPTRHAARSLARIFQREDLVLSEDIRQFDFYGNLVLLGGPLANQTTRLLMGLDGRSELLKTTSRAFSFPFHFDIETSISQFDRGEPGSWRGAMESHQRKAPIWTIYRGGKEYVRPKLVANALADDFLILTSLPNILNRKSYENGSRITMLSGAHSVGMRAVHDLLESRPLLERLLSDGHGKKAWQALLTIDDIHSNGFPKSLHPHFEVAEVKADFDGIVQDLEQDRLF